MIFSSPGLARLLRQCTQQNISNNIDAGDLPCQSIRTVVPCGVGLSRRLRWIFISWINMADDEQIGTKSTSHQGRLGLLRTSVAFVDSFSVVFGSHNFYTVCGAVSIFPAHHPEMHTPQVLLLTSTSPTSRNIKTYLPSLSPSIVRTIRSKPDFPPQPFVLPPVHGWPATRAPSAPLHRKRSPASH